MEKVKEGKPKFDKKAWEGISSEAIDLIQKMLQVDPDKRYSAEQCLAHEWIVKNDTRVEVQPKMIQDCLQNLKSFRVLIKIIYNKGSTATLGRNIHIYCKFFINKGAKK